MAASVRMVRSTKLSLVLATAVLSGAATAGSNLEAAFGNTIVSTYPDGRTGRLWLDKDGSYAASGRRHDPSSGRWSLSGDKICLRQSRPIPVPFHYCAPVPHGGLGAAWSGKAVTGEPIRLQLVAGRGE